MNVGFWLFERWILAVWTFSCVDVGIWLLDGFWLGGCYILVV